MAAGGALPSFCKPPPAGGLCGLGPRGLSHFLLPDGGWRAVWLQTERVGDSKTESAGRSTALRRLIRPQNWRHVCSTVVAAVPFGQAGAAQTDPQDAEFLISVNRSITELDSREPRPARSAANLWRPP
jgi:hypothetical protein